MLHISEDKAMKDSADSSVNPSQNFHQWIYIHLTDTFPQDLNTEKLLIIGLFRGLGYFLGCKQEKMHSVLQNAQEMSKTS